MRDDVMNLISPYSKSIEERGVVPEGVLWPNARDLAIRFEVLLGAAGLGKATADSPIRLLDLGCGPAFLLDYLSANNALARVDYTGVDVAEVMIEHARARWPGHCFELRDVREQPFANDSFDFCIACGVFTARFGNSYPSMIDFTKGTLAAVWRSVTTGLAFNVMSKHVDWERDDLFHWPLDEVMRFCKSALSRHVLLRMDYGLWEVSVIVLREPLESTSLVPVAWLGKAR
jgi:SAM-dependent methyltransferase